MQKHNVMLKSVGIFIFAYTATLPVHATDWSVTKSVSPYNLRMSGGSCYDEPDKMKVSFDWTKSLVGYDSINVAVECACGETLKINDAIEVSLKNLIELANTDFPLELSSFKCMSE